MAVLDYPKLWCRTPCGVKEKKHLNIAPCFCRQRESNPGCLCGKQVHHPILHSLSILGTVNILRIRWVSFKAEIWFFQEKLKDYVDRDGGKFDASRMITGADRRTIETLTRELEEQRELAANRLAELVRILVLSSFDPCPGFGLIECWCLTKVASVAQGNALQGSFTSGNIFRCCDLSPWPTDLILVALARYSCYGSGWSLS